MQEKPKFKRRRAPNRFDREAEYDIVEDMTAQKANITFGQFLKESPRQAAKFRQAFRRPLIKADQ